MKNKPPEKQSLLRLESPPAPVASDFQRSLFRVTLAAFFFSGLSALFYQVIWLRQLSTTFGNTTLAIALTLTAFMTGLAMGSYAFGRWGDRIARPFRLYGWLEMVIGLYGLASLHLLRAVHSGYIFLAGRLPFDSPWLASFQFWACFLVLLVPTALMGGTLPIVSKGLVRRLETVAPEVGKLYGVNTFGAAVGVLLVGFFLLPILGLSGSVTLAALANLVIGLAVLKYEARSAAAESQALPGSAPAPEANPGRTAADPPLARPLLAILVIGFALSGFSGLALEVVWARAFALYIGCSVYVFSAVLFAVLIGIALGSVLVAWLSRRHEITLAWFAGAQLGAGISSFALVFLYNLLPFFLLSLIVRFGASFSLLLSLQVLVILGCLLLPALFSGATFPILSRLCVREGSALCRGIGLLYAANTVGCILGAFTAGFLLIPHIGLRVTVLLCSSLYLVTGAAVFLHGRGRSRVAGVLTLAALVGALYLLPSWNQNVMSAGLFRTRSAKPGEAVDLEQAISRAREFAKRNVKVLFYREGSLATVAVTTDLEGIRTLRFNGKPDAGDDPDDMNTQVLIAHLPLLLADRADSVLVVGLGSAATCGAASLYPVRRIDCVEIEPAVVQAADYFRHINRNIFSDRRFTLIPADARNYLAASRQNYDVILSEPSNPWVAGVASLFTVEHFQALRDRLSPDGVICQWIQLYEMTPENLASVLTSFVKVFPETTLWWLGPAHADVALIAKLHPWKVDFRQLAARVHQHPQVRPDLNRGNFDSPLSVVSSLLMGPADLRRFSEIGEPNTDDLPRLEFSAPRGLYLSIRQTYERTARLLAGYKSQPLDDFVELGPAGRDPDSRATLARFFTDNHPQWQRPIYYGWIREQLSAAVALDPRRADLYQELAQAEVLIGDPASARLHLRKALQLNPGLESARELLAQVERAPN